MKKCLIGLLFLSTSAFATSTNTRGIDDIFNLSGGSTLSIPSVGSTFATDSNTLTLTNKSISGASNTISNLAASVITSGQLGVTNGGTGDSTLTLNGMLFGNGTSAVGITSAGSQYQVFQAGSSGVPTVGALHLDQSAAVTGTLPVANGGTGQSSLSAHDVLVGNGTSGVTQVSPTSNVGYVLTSNGTGSDPSFQLPSIIPTINNSATSPQSVTAAGGISLSTPSYVNFVFMEASTSGTTTLTATPEITPCTAVGQILYVISGSATNLVKIQTIDDLAGSQVVLNGPWTSGKNGSAPFVLSLYCDGAGTPSWVEFARNN